MCIEQVHVQCASNHKTFPNVLHYSNNVLEYLLLSLQHSRQLSLNSRATVSIFLIHSLAAACGVPYRLRAVRTGSCKTKLNDGLCLYMASPHLAARVCLMSCPLLELLAGFLVASPPGRRLHVWVGQDLLDALPAEQLAVNDNLAAPPEELSSHWEAAAPYSSGAGGGGTAAGRGGRALLGLCQSSTAPRNSLSRSAPLDFFPLLAAASLRRTSRVFPAEAGRVPA